MKYEWKDSGHTNTYYYRCSDGMVVGQTHNISHTKIWVAKIIHNLNEEKNIGLYISEEYAKMAVENYWLIETHTLIG
jgi:hypothetical protein